LRPKVAIGIESVFRAPIHPDDRRCNAEVVAEPETRTAAELDREILELALRTHQTLTPIGISGSEISRGREPAHLTLQPRLPADGQGPQLLRVADRTLAPKLVELDIPLVPCAIGGTSDPEIPAQNRRRFDTVAHRVSESVDFGSCLRS